MTESPRIASDARRTGTDALIQSEVRRLIGDEQHVRGSLFPDRNGPIARILDMLGDMGVQSLLVEGGGHLERSSSIPDSLTE